MGRIGSGILQIEYGQLGLYDNFDLQRRERVARWAYQRFLDMGQAICEGKTAGLRLGRRVTKKRRNPLSRNSSTVKGMQITQTRPGGRLVLRKYAH
jgi:hypothetical protein